MESPPAADAPKARRPRVHQRKLVGVWALPEEKTAIDEHARRHGLSTSNYLLRLGLGFEPQSTLDAEAVRTLAKVNGDQGRLGGLLKLLLTNDDKLRASKDKPALVAEIRALLRQIEKAQGDLLVAVNRL